MSFAIVGAIPTPATARGKKRCQYTVKKGDTVSRIARRAGVSEANLIKANPKLRKNPNRLRVGQTLEVCKAKRREVSRPQSCGDHGKLITHTVKKGETVAGIAARYSVSRKSVLRRNKRLAKRKNSMIRVGETLKVCTTLRRYTNRSWFSGGIQLPPGDGYNIRRPANAWGKPSAIEGIVAALGRYRELEPDAPLVQVGDISQQNGGPLRAHVSHQEGRDVDIGYVYDAPTEEDGKKTLNLARSLALVRSFTADPNVGTIFMSYRLQKRLYEFAKANGEDVAALDAVFEYPRHDNEAVIVHWPGHTAHFHVRFAKQPREADEPGAGPTAETGRTVNARPREDCLPQHRRPLAVGALPPAE